MPQHIRCLPLVHGFRLTLQALAMATLVAGALLIGGSSSANTVIFVKNTSSDLDAPGSYTPNGAPNIASDVTFASPNYQSTTFTLNTAPLSIGSLDDLDTSQALTISATQSLTLNGGDSVTGSSPSDLLYLTNGANLSISGTGGIVLAASGNFDIGGGGGGASTTQATISAAISGSQALTKTGAGTLTLSGTNTYTGGTTVSAGTLFESNNGNALSKGTVAIGASSTLALSNTSTSTTVSQAGATTFTGMGTLQKTGAGTVQFGGNGGNVNVSLGAGGLIDVEAGTLAGSSSHQGFYTNNLAGLNIAGGATFDGVEGTIIVDALTGAGTLQGGYSGIVSTTIGINNGSGTFSGVIRNNGNSGGTLALIKAGTGTQILTGVNTYTGGTTISAGELDLGDGTTSNGSVVGNIINNGSLGFANPTSQTFAGVISGTGDLYKSGTGILTLSGADTYTGITSVNAGMLTVNTGGSLSGGGISVRSSGAFVLGGTGMISESVEYIGDNGQGSFNQTGGTNAIVGPFYVGYSLSSSGLGTYTLGGTGSTLSAANEYIGDGLASTGTFTQTGGTNTVGSLLFLGANGAASDGTYNLSGNSALSAANEYIGYIGTGTFNQSGGTNTVSDTLIIGYYNFGSNTYNLGGTGTLSASIELVGRGSTGTGTFNQNGGSNTISSVLDLNYNCAYNLSGTGVLSAQYESIYGGAFSQSGGTNTISSQLTLVNSTATYNLSGTGALSAPTESVVEGTFNQSGGTNTVSGQLTITISDTDTVPGTYTLGGGVLQAGSVTGGGGTSTFNFNGGVLQASTNGGKLIRGLTTANVQAGGAKIDTNGFNITIDQNLLHDTTSGAPAIDGGLTKLGAGTLSFTGVNTYTGANIVLGGTLLLSGITSTAPGTATGGILQYAGVTLVPGYNTLTAGSNGTILYTGGTTVTGGYLSGSGSQTVGTGGASFLGTTINNGPTLQVNAATSLTNVTSSGAVSLPARQILTWNGGSNYLGSLTASGTANTSNWTSSGVITINNGGLLANAASNLVLGGGSRTTINAGGTLSTASGTTIELNGGLLTNNGTQTGTLDVNYGSTAKGTGTFGSVNVGDGGKFGSSSVTGGGNSSTNAAPATGLTQNAGTTPFASLQPSSAPGTTNVSSLTLNAGGTLSTNVQNATSGAGTGYDTVHATGALTLNGYSTVGNQITLGLSSLGLDGSPGMATGFDPTRSYVFTLVTADGGITGFSTNEFTVNTSGFQNSLGNGYFSVAQDGNNLDVDFIPVPEPATWAGALGCVGLLARTLSRKRCNVRRM